MQKRRRTKETEVKNITTISSLLKTSVSVFQTSLSLRNCAWLWETEINMISRTFILRLLYMVLETVCKPTVFKIFTFA